jgi:hypothetical protein
MNKEAIKNRQIDELKETLNALKTPTTTAPPGAPGNASSSTSRNGDGGIDDVDEFLDASNDLTDATTEPTTVALQEPPPNQNEGFAQRKPAILDTVIRQIPESYHSKASKLAIHLESLPTNEITWNEGGEVSLGGRILPGTDIRVYFEDICRNKGQVNVTEDFKAVLSAILDSNPPAGSIVNKFLVDRVLAKTRAGVKQLGSGLRLRTPIPRLRWEPYRW